MSQTSTKLTSLRIFSLIHCLLHIVISRIPINLVLVAIFKFFINSFIVEGVGPPTFYRRSSRHLSSSNSLGLNLLPFPPPLALYHKDDNDDSGDKEEDGEGGNDDENSWRPWSKKKLNQYLQNTSTHIRLIEIPIQSCSSFWNFCLNCCSRLISEQFFFGEHYLTKQFLKTNNYKGLKVKVNSLKPSSHPKVCFPVNQSTWTLWIKKPYYRNLSIAYIANMTLASPSLLPQWVVHQTWMKCIYKMMNSGKHSPKILQTEKYLCFHPADPKQSSSSSSGQLILESGSWSTGLNEAVVGSLEVRFRRKRSRTAFVILQSPIFQLHSVVPVSHWTKFPRRIRKVDKRSACALYIQETDL